MKTVQQSAVDALATWLSSQLSGVVVEARWPAPSKALPPKALSICMTGPRRDEDLQPEMLATTNVGSTSAKSRWRMKACEQPIQLDVWAKTDPERDDVLARLDVALNCGELAIPSFFNPSPIGYGVLVKLTDADWTDTFCDFQFENAEITDAPDALERAEYRATIRGTGYVMLALSHTTARQTVINFNANLARSGDLVAIVDHNGFAITL